MLSVMTPPVAVLEQPPTPASPNFYKLPFFQTSSKDRFLSRVERSLVKDLTPELLQIMSTALSGEYNSACQESNLGMLPSFCHTLPSGDEQGAFLAIDVGGSTLRVALVQLNGRSQGGKAVCVLISRHHIIDQGARGLVGRAFFSWMADRVYETLDGESQRLYGKDPLRIGLAWSFPIEQLSIRDGLLMQMGKGFHAVDGLIGANLADLVSDACRAKHLNVTVDAIVNDSSSSLMSGAYLSTSSPIALILGTGLNATVDLSVSAIARRKFGVRPAAWHAAAQRVLTNTELSLYGRSVFPITKWDHDLKRAHPRPDFQPLEYLTSGGYLGEISRLIISDAIEAAGLFDGVLPTNFDSYAFTTETAAAIERDTSPSLSRANAIMTAKHPLPNGKRYSAVDLSYLRRIVTLVSSRAAAYLAASVHALYQFKYQHEPKPMTQQDIVVSCNGSVLDKYPDFLARMQDWLDILMSKTPASGSIKLELTGESVLLGAAVAVACQSSG